MSIPPPRGLPRRVFIPVRLPDEGGAGTAQLVAHTGCRALALPPLSPHVAAAAATADLRSPTRAPLAPHTPVQGLGALVNGLAVLVLLKHAIWVIFGCGGLINDGYFCRINRARRGWLILFKFFWDYQVLGHKSVIGRLWAMLWSAKNPIKSELLSIKVKSKETRKRDSDGCKVSQPHLSS